MNRPKNLPIFQDAVTLGNLQKRNRIFKKFIKSQLAAHRQAPGVKSALASPFTVKWPKTPHDVQTDVTEKFKNALSILKDEQRRGGRKKKAANEATSTGDDFTDQVLAERKKNHRQKINDIRQTLVFGINEVTRKMERDELAAIVVCSSSANVCPTNHLQVLAASRRCPALCIRDFSTNVGKVCGINSLLVVGIRKSPPAPQVDWVDELLNVIRTRSVPLYVPWVELGLEIDPEAADDDDSPNGRVGEEDNKTTTDDVTPAPEKDVTTLVKDEKPVNVKKEQATESVKATVSKPFDIDSLYIKAADSDWLKDESKIVPVIGGSNSFASQNFIKLSDGDTSSRSKTDGKDAVTNWNPWNTVVDEREGEEVPRKKRRKMIFASYLPPHVKKVPRDDERKKKIKEKVEKKKAKKAAATKT